MQRLNVITLEGGSTSYNPGAELWTRSAWGLTGLLPNPRVAPTTASQVLLLPVSSSRPSTGSSLPLLNNYGPNGPSVYFSLAVGIARLYL